MKWIKNITGLFFLISFFLGALFQFLMPHLPWVSLSAWGGALFFLIVWGVLNREKVLAFFLRKSVHYGANVGLIILLVFGILTALNVLSKEYSLKRDLTRAGVNTLSEQTVKILKGLDKKVDLTFFADAKAREKTEKLLRLYRDKSKNFRYRIVDPNREPALTRALGIKRNNSGVFTVEGSEKKVSVEEFTEEKFTNALVKLLKTKEQTIYFTSGHEERAVDDVAEVPNSITAIKRELENQGYTVKNLNLVSENTIPKDASAIAVVGPRGQFFPRELDLLRDWVKKGGRLLVAQELDVARSGLTSGSVQMAGLLKEFGINTDVNIIVDPQSREPQVALGLVADQEHPIVKDFPKSNLGLVANFLFPITTRLITEAAPKGMKLLTLVKTSPNAWPESDWKSVKKGEVNFDPKHETRGQLSLVVAAEGEGDLKSRIVAFASSSFMSNGLLGLARNRDLVLNAIGWLTDQEGFISIRPKADGEGESIDLTQQWLNIVFLVTVVLVPAAILGSGVFVWIRRRGR